MEVPVVQCPCGKGRCSIFTSHTKKNPDRKFYSCCQISRKCGFFIWVDEVLEFRATLCPCGAGACSLNRDKNGCWFFACRIKKGHGACPFSQWADSCVNSKMNKHLRRSTGWFSPGNVKTNHQVINTLHSEEDETPERVSVMKETESLEPSCNLFRKEMEFSNDQVLDPLHFGEDELPNRDLNIIEREFSSDLVLNHLHSEENGLPNQGLTIFEREFSNHQVLDTLNSKADEVPHQVLVEKDRKSPYFLSLKKVCCQSENLCKSGLEVSTTKSNDHENSTRQNCNSSQNDSVSASVFKNFGQGLLNVLEDENLADRERMLAISETTLAALRSLSVNISSFSEHVMKYIDCKSNLATLENSMRKGLSCQELADIFHVKEACFERIACQHTEKKAEYEAVESYFLSLCEEFSCVKDVSHNLQEGLERSQAKMLALKTSVLKIECQMSLSKRSMEVARKEMNEAIVLEKRRKRLQHEARTALESAKAELSIMSVGVNRSLFAQMKKVNYAVVYIYALVLLVALVLYSICVVC